MALGGRGKPHPSGKRLRRRKPLARSVAHVANAAKRQFPKGAVLGSLIFYYAFCSSAHYGAGSRHAGTPRPDRGSGQGASGEFSPQRTAFFTSAAILAGRAMTASRNSALRFFLLGIGLLLLNAWVFLRWEFARLLAHGPYRVNEPLFRFHRFTRLLIRSIEKIYSTLRAIPTYKLPQSVTY